MIPNRQTDPVGHARWWFGDDLVQVLHERADANRIELHSGLVPNTKPREALQLLKRLATRNLLTRLPGRSRRIVFALHDKAVIQYFRDAADKRQAQAKGEA